jgi:hypothetical protein
MSQNEWISVETLPEPTGEPIYECRFAGSDSISYPCAYFTHGWATLWEPGWEELKSGFVQLSNVTHYRKLATV